MALVKFGGGIIQMSGSIAGNTFARNRYGNYVRARTKPTNPNTTRQQGIRSAIAEATVRWSTVLNQAGRDIWNLYAANVAMKNRLGETVTLTGFNHYIRSNALRLQLGFAAIDAGPDLFELPAHDPSLAIAPAEASQQCNVTFDNTMDWANETGGVLFIYQGMSQNPQRNFFAGPWRWCTCVGGDDVTPPVSPEPAPAVYHLSVGQHIWVYARIQRADGRLSEKFRADNFCAA